MSDIRDAKEGETWKATWFSGYGGPDDYMDRNYVVKSVEGGNVFVMDSDEPIPMGTIWTKQQSGGKKIQTKKRKGKSRKNYRKSYRRLPH